VGTSAEQAVAPVLARLRDQADEMLADLRRIVSGLRPPALDELGLVEAVRLQAAEVAPSAGLIVDVVAEGDLGPLPAAVEVAAYRIALEAVLNAVRHSGGRRCRVDMRRDDGLRLAIRDDGRGISASGAVGVGMQSMHARPRSAAGSWSHRPYRRAPRSARGSRRWSDVRADPSHARR
jgi:signal transduction histidine kinase